jgi:hypothetical protein
VSPASRLAALWRNLMRRDRVERELDDELRTTLDLLVDEKTRRACGRTTPVVLRPLNSADWRQ